MKAAYILIIGCVATLMAGSALGAVPDEVSGPLALGVDQGARLTVGANGETVVTFPACEDPFTGDPKRREANGFKGFAIGSTEDAFTGDYEAAGITGVGVTIASEGPLCGSVKLLLVSGGRQWTKMVEGLTDEDGVPQTVEVAFDVAEGWYAYVADGDLAAALASDLRNVDAIGLIISVCRSPEQIFTITDFVLKSDGGDIEVPLSPLAQRLQRFGDGVTTIAQAEAAPGAGADDDGDGLTALQEALIGTSDSDAASTLKAVVVERTQTSAKVSWKIGSDAADVTYKVLRADSLTDEFTTLESGIGVDHADGEGNILWVDDEIGSRSAAFYRVIAVVPDEA